MRAWSQPGTVVTWQDRVRCLCHTEPGAGCRLVQSLGTTQCFHLCPRPVAPGPLSGQTRAGPGAGVGVASHTTHLVQTHELCPVPTQHGIKVRLFSSSPATQDPPARLGLYLPVRHSEAQGQQGRERMGQCWPVHPNTRPALSPCRPLSSRTGGGHCPPEHCRKQFVTSGGQQLDLLLEGSQLSLVPGGTCHPV